MEGRNILLKLIEGFEALSQIMFHQNNTEICTRVRSSDLCACEGHETVEAYNKGKCRH